jgi:hypothetical protein
VPIVNADHPSCGRASAHRRTADILASNLRQLALALALLFAPPTHQRVVKETVVNQKRMFKVLSPIEKEGGNTYWMRCGTGFVNKDNSINVYLDAIPCKTKSGEGVKLHLREMTEEDFKEQAARRASYSSRGTLDPNLSPYSPAQVGPGPVGGAGADSLPF